MTCGGASAPPLRRVCFFGTYARDYTVTQLMFQACTAAGIEVVECHEPLWERTRHKQARYFGARSLVRLLLQYARHACVLERRRRAIGSVPLYVIGFNGQLDCLLLRLLLRGHRVPIVLAPLISLTETLVEDRAVYAPRSLAARLVRWLDRTSMAAATRVIFDAEAHCEYVSRTFGTPPERISTWYLGADPLVFRPTPAPSPRRQVRVLFYGSYLPLHGVRTIVEAAILLRSDRNIEFTLVGDGPEAAPVATMVRDASLNQVQVVDWVPYEKLGQAVAAADICLGVFGDTAKTQMVIPNKVYQAAAVGRPVITADTAAVREVFAHGETAWLCPPGNPAALAEAIRGLSTDPAGRERLGRQAAAFMAERFSPQSQGRRFADILAQAAA